MATIFFYGSALMPLNWADWTIVGIVAVSCVFSLLRGFTKEVLSLLSWVAASFVAMAFDERLATIFSKWISTPSICQVLAFTTLFVLTLLIGMIINWLLHEFVIDAGLGGVDRVFGMVFGAARGLLIALALVIFLPMFLPEMKRDLWWHQSRLLPYFEASESWARAMFRKVMGLRKTLAEKAQALEHEHNSQQ
jgi:membrane protein required for colicin V production